MSDEQLSRFARVARAVIAFMVWMTLNISLSFSNKYLFVYKVGEGTRVFFFADVDF